MNLKWKEKSNFKLYCLSILLGIVVSCFCVMLLTGIGISSSSAYANPDEENVDNPSNTTIDSDTKWDKVTINEKVEIVHNASDSTIDIEVVGYCYINCIVVKNTSVRFWGSGTIYMQNDLTASDTIFITSYNNNQLLVNEDRSVSFDGVTLDGNNKTTHWAIALAGDATASTTVNFTNCNIDNFNCNGGNILATSNKPDTVNITNTNIKKNQVHDCDGVFSITHGGTLNFNSGKVSDNLSYCRVEPDGATAIFVIWDDGSTINMYGGEICKNYSNNYGGGLASEGGNNSINVYGGSIHDNKVKTVGGGIYVYSETSLSISGNAQIIDNVKVDGPSAQGVGQTNVYLETGKRIELSPNFTGKIGVSVNLSGDEVNDARHIPITNDWESGSPEGFVDSENVVADKNPDWFVDCKRKYGNCLLLSNGYDSTISVYGKVTLAESNSKPNVLAIGYLSDTKKFYKSDPIEVDNNGNYLITDVPSTFVGVITAGASGYANGGKAVYANQQKDISGNFDLIKGSDCTFVKPEHLTSYLIKAGSEVYTQNQEGQVKVTIPQDLDAAEFIPFGLRFNSSLKVNYDYYGYGSITYSHNGANQGINLTLVPKPNSGYYFSHWKINDQVAFGTFDVKETDTQVNVLPVLNDNYTMTVGGTIQDNDDAILTSEDNAYAMLIGYSIFSNGIYISEQVYASALGQYEFRDVPVDFIGIVFAGASKHTNQAKLVYYTSQLADFSLYSGAQFILKQTPDLKTVMLKSGSCINIEELHDPIIFEEDINLPYTFPAIGLPFESVINFNADGELVYDYKSTDTNANIEVNFTFQAVGQEGKTFSYWNKNGEVFAGEYKPNKNDGDFTVEPVFGGGEPTPIDPGSHNASNTSDFSPWFILILIMVYVVCQMIFFLSISYFKKK